MDDPRVLLPLAGLSFGSPSGAARSSFPWTVPFVRQELRLQFGRPVTLFVGENGAGKSTLLEAVAVEADLPSAGSDDVQRDPTLWAARELSSCLRLSWNRRARTGFFLRAEDFFGYARRTQTMKAEAEAELGRIRAEDGPLALHAQPHAGAVHALRHLYGEGLDARSHGEAFLRLFEARVRGGGLFILDEPEAALSPLRQLSLISLVRAATERGAQFLIATHSPVLLAFPGAQILQVDAEGVREARYDDLEHVRLMRDFLANPGAFLRHL